MRRKEREEAAREERAPGRRRRHPQKRANKASDKQRGRSVKEEETKVDKRKGHGKPTTPGAASPHLCNGDQQLPIAFRRQQTARLVTQLDVVDKKHVRPPGGAAAETVSANKKTHPVVLVGQIAAHAHETAPRVRVRLCGLCFVGISNGGGNLERWHGVLRWRETRETEVRHPHASAPAVHGDRSMHKCAPFFQAPPQSPCPGPRGWRTSPW